MQESDQMTCLLKEISLFNRGDHDQAYQFLGAKRVFEEQNMGYRFSVWAPRAWQVYLQGDFSDWQNKPMVKLDGGVWTLFVQNAKAGQCYKYGIDHGNGHIEYKIDPFALRFERPPQDASIIEDLEVFPWTDQLWMANRQAGDKYAKPMQIYEVHLASWRRHYDGSHYSFHDLVESLIPYVKEMGYTHIELMPVMAFPLDASWGYQLTGYFAVAAQYGSNAGLKHFINCAHQAGIGVILDWVPGHFNRNANALAYFDGTPTYEYEDPDRAANIGWGALNFDLGKAQVRAFLKSNLNYWLKEFHADGIRVDALSNMLYLDFDEGPWKPNKDGGNLNLEAWDFWTQLNQWVNDKFPAVYMIAEESTSSQGITQSVEDRGLGFDYKWNMGWMNDILRFFNLPAQDRPAQLRLLTFVFMYQFKERYILPFSHDEVVHGKSSLLGKLPGSRFDQFADLRLLHAYMLTQPGKSLHFMGNELGQFLEWRFYEELDWAGLQRPYNQEYQDFIQALNHFALANPEFYQQDHSWSGLTVLDADDLERGIISLIRWGNDPDHHTVVVMNVSKGHYYDVKLGLPRESDYQVVLHSQALKYGGYIEDWQKTYSAQAQSQAFQGQNFATHIEVPAQSCQFLQVKTISNRKE